MSLFPKTTLTDAWINTKQPDQYHVPSIDFFGEPRYVTKLNKETFNDFLNEKDVALVMFYDPRDKDSSDPRKQITLAASGTFRASHAYAAVNCVKESQLCNRERITSLPIFKIYSRGQHVGTITDYSTFNAEVMWKYVTNFPILNNLIGQLK